MPEPTDTKALAALRPGDPMEKLAAAIGERWLAPEAALAGKVEYLKEDFRFTARLDREWRIGKVSFEYGFDPEATIEGLRMLMPEEEVRRARPDMRISDGLAGPYSFGDLDLSGDVYLGCQIGHGQITRLWIGSDEAIYPDKGPMPLPPPKTTFDVSVVPGPQPRGSAAPDGWCFGLPRGIAPLQWPLSTRWGFPLKHHFTVRVPESYRVKGEAFVALAVFSDTSEDGRAVPSIAKLMNVIFDGRSLPDTVEPGLEPLLDHLRNRHPMEFRAKDILYSNFAGIWLTEDEFSGHECEPPDPLPIALAGRVTSPPWLKIGSIFELFGGDGREPYNADHYLHHLAGRLPRGKWDFLRLRLREVDDDPNVGKRPVDEFLSEDDPDGYILPYGESETLENPYSQAHFGGTCFPNQAVPDLTAFYIEIDATMGLVYNGGGKGQLDLVTMRIDWAQ